MIVDRCGNPLVEVELFQFFFGRNAVEFLKHQKHRLIVNRDKSIVFAVLPFEQNSLQAEPEIFITFKVPLNPKVNTVAVIRLFIVFHRFGIRKNFVQCIKIRMSVFAENEPLCLKFNSCL